MPLFEQNSDLRIQNQFFVRLRSLSFIWQMTGLAMYNHKFLNIICQAKTSQQGVRTQFLRFLGCHQKRLRLHSMAMGILHGKGTFWYLELSVTEVELLQREGTREAILRHRACLGRHLENRTRNNVWPQKKTIFYLPGNISTTFKSSRIKSALSVSVTDEPRS